VLRGDALVFEGLYVRHVVVEGGDRFGAHHHLRHPVAVLVAVLLVVVTGVDARVPELQKLRHLSMR
jgi:hypothetical protein